MQTLWLTTEETAQYLSMSKRTVEKRIKDGTFPSVKIGQLRRVDKDALDAALRALAEVPA